MRDFVGVGKEKTRRRCTHQFCLVAEWRDWGSAYERKSRDRRRNGMDHKNTPDLVKANYVTTFFPTESLLQFIDIHY